MSVYLDWLEHWKVRKCPRFTHSPTKNIPTPLELWGSGVRFVVGKPVEAPSHTGSGALVFSAFILQNEDFFRTVQSIERLMDA
jgi:hypothetical protein